MIINIVKLISNNIPYVAMCACAHNVVSYAHSRNLIKYFDN